jgi:hypothetical protein
MVLTAMSPRAQPIGPTTTPLSPNMQGGPNLQGGMSAFPDPRNPAATNLGAGSTATTGGTTGTGRGSLAPAGLPPGQPPGQLGALPSTSAAPGLTTTGMNPMNTTAPTNSGRPGTAATQSTTPSAGSPGRTSPAAGGQASGGATTGTGSAGCNRVGASFGVSSAEMPNDCPP